MTTSKSTISTKKTTAKKTVAKKPVLDPELSLANFCVEAALDKKAENPVILDLRDISTFTDFFVLVSASSEPQIKAIASCVRDRMRSEKGISPHADDAYPGSRWIVIDFGSVIVHVFHQELRDLYNLESLWNDAKKIVVKEKKRSKKKVSDE